MDYPFLAKEDLKAWFRRCTSHELIRTGSLGWLELIEVGWIDSDAYLYSSRTKFKKEKTRISVNCIINIYAFGSTRVKRIASPT